MVAFIDTQQFSPTQLGIQTAIFYPHLRCFNVCGRYRGALRALGSKAKATEANSSQRTAHDSHTKISCFQSTEVVAKCARGL